LAEIVKCRVLWDSVRRDVGREGAALQEGRGQREKEIQHSRDIT
jgi:hypothetical protein